MNKPYILPIGERCHTYEVLKTVTSRRELTFFASLGGVSLDMILKFLSAGFDECLKPENIKIAGEGNETHYFTHDTISKIRISHTFPISLPIEESIKKHFPVLRRLYNKTINQINKSDDLLMLHCSLEYTYPIETVTEICKQLRKLYPKKNITFLIYLYSHDVTKCQETYNHEGIKIYRMPFHPNAAIHQYFYQEKVTDEHNMSYRNMKEWSNWEMLKKHMKKHITSYIREKKTPHIWKYWKYRILSKLTMGHKRAKYTKKKKTHKAYLDSYTSL